MHCEEVVGLYNAAEKWDRDHDMAMSRHVRTGRAVQGLLWLIERAALERSKVRSVELEAKKSRSRAELIVEDDGTQVLRFFSDDGKVFAEDRIEHGNT